MKNCFPGCVNILLVTLYAFSSLSASGGHSTEDRISAGTLLAKYSNRSAEITEMMPSVPDYQSMPRIEWFIKGTCYSGNSQDEPISGLPMRCSIQPVEMKSSVYTSSIQWDQIQPAITNSNGLFGFRNVGYLGEYYILINPEPYALQWLDGSSIYDQPEPTVISGDTTHRDINVTMGGKLAGIVKDPQSGMLQGPITISLLNNKGFVLFRDYLLENETAFSFSGIPDGDYFLHVKESYYYESQLYSNSSTIGSAQSLAIRSSNVPNDTIRWTLKRASPEIDDPDGNLTLAAFDSTGNGLAVIIYYLESSRMSYSSSSQDTIEMSVSANKKFFVARVPKRNDLSQMSFSWYPGSFFKADAETLSVESYGQTFVWLPLAENGGTISGKLPSFNDPDVMYSSVFFSAPKKTLGVEAYVDSLGYFSATVAAGLYDIQCVPVTNGYKICTGGSALTIKGAEVVKGQNTAIGYPTSQNYSHSIKGSLECKNDPAIACFDTLGNLVSMTTLSIKKSYENQAGIFGRFFPCEITALTSPHRLQYAINFLSKGRYALVQIEPVDSVHTFSLQWYGGLAAQKLICSVDDIASLPIPDGIRWVTVDDSSGTTDIGMWESNRTKKIRRIPGTATKISIRKIAANRLAITFPFQNAPSRLKVFSCKGALLKTVWINSGNSEIIDASEIVKPGGVYIFELLDVNNKYIGCVSNALF